jgi:hypothetical protein
MATDFSRIRESQIHGYEGLETGRSSRPNQNGPGATVGAIWPKLADPRMS